MLRSRVLGWAALPLTVAAMAVATVLPATALASGGGCVSSGVVRPCVEVDGWSNYVGVVKASFDANPRSHLAGRLHVWGPSGLNLTHPVSFSAPSWHVGSYPPFTWGVYRKIATGPVCAQFEVYYGAPAQGGGGWERYGSGPACITVHP
jgi:hypothetical protein